MHGKGMPESFTKGQQIAQLQGKPLICFGPQHGFKKFGKIGPGDLRTVPAHRQRGRRRLHHPLHVDRADQSRSGAHDHEHGLDHPGPAQHGVVGALRAGRGDGGSAGLRRAALRGPGRPDAADRGAAVVGGTAAQQVPGREAELRRRPGAVHQEPARHEREDAAGIDRRDQRAERAGVHDAAGSRDSDAHRAVRDGVQDADAACPTWWT